MTLTDELPIKPRIQAARAAVEDAAARAAGEDAPAVEDVPGDNPAPVDDLLDALEALEVCSQQADVRQSAAVCVGQTTRQTCKQPRIAAYCAVFVHCTSCCSRM